MNKHWYFNISFGATDKSGGVVSTVVALDVPYLNEVAMANVRQQNGIGISAPVMAVCPLGRMTSQEYAGTLPDAVPARAGAGVWVAGLVALVVILAGLVGWLSWY